MQLGVTERLIYRFKNAFQWIRACFHDILALRFLKHGRRLLNNNDKIGALQVFDSGIARYKYSVKLHLEAARLNMEMDNHASSLLHLGYVVDLKKNITADTYTHYAMLLYRNNQVSKSVKTLESGIEKYPNHIGLLENMIQIANSQEDWKRSATYLQQYFSIVDISPLDIHFWELITAYEKLHLYDEATKLLQETMIAFPNEDRLNTALLEIGLKMKAWTLCIDCLQRNGFYQSSKENMVTLSMLYQIVGEAEKSRGVFSELLRQYGDHIGKDQDGYRKLIVFDNGESRIEFYKQLRWTDSIIVTFDSINMKWDDPSFAFNLLQRQNLDIVAIRKRTAKTYQQDLTQNDFLHIVEPLLKGYKDKMAYGFSLGAYNALHFASLLDCRILAFSPRLSIHPIYGRTKIIPKFEMKQDLTQPDNDRISPIIVYDPKNKLDHRYIHEHLLKAFPRTRLIKHPYGGHGVVPHLRDMGLLKDFVLTFIRNGVPHYDKSKKGQSYAYLTNLGKACLKHHKLKWADQLANRALVLKEDDVSLKLKMNVLKQQANFAELITFSKKAIEKKPKQLDFRLFLIDAYLESGNHEQAVQNIETAENIFGEDKRLNARKTRL